MNNFTKNKHLKVLVCYGSENGYAESLAQDIYKSLPFIETKISSMNEVIIEQMNSYDFIIFILSTNKLGTFPINANLFYNNIKLKEHKFNFKYSIIGIGDSSYENFCLPAKKVEIYLSKTGSNNLLKNIYLDDSIDHNYEYNKYKSDLIDILKKEDLKIKKWFTESMNNKIT